MFKELGLRKREIGVYNYSGIRW